jgi:glutamate-1-semialdehyde 2,1-aminomutase
MTQLPSPVGASRTALPESSAWLRRAGQRIPGGTSTIAKTPARLIEGVSPLCAVRAAGSRFVDVDGHEWLDCEMAMGTTPWGHARGEVVQAIIRQATLGSSFSTPHHSELELADLLLARFPHFESLRFLKSGADAMNAAVRIARAATGRHRVITTEYHGAADWSVAGKYHASGAQRLGLTPRALDETVHVPVGDHSRLLDAVSGDIAAVVICPNNWSPGQVAAVRQRATSQGAVLIFDEITSGMRIGRQATAGRYGIWPDLLCISKGLTNGLPLSVVLGSRTLVEKTLGAQITSAHATEAVSVAAAIACEGLLAAAPHWPSWEDSAQRLIGTARDRLAGAGLHDTVAVTGDYASFALATRAWPDFWTDPVREALVRSFAQESIFTKGYIVLSDAHTEADIERIEHALVASIELAANQNHHQRQD